VSPIREVRLYPAKQAFRASSGIHRFLRACGYNASVADTVVIQFQKIHEKFTAPGAAMGAFIFRYTTSVQGFKAV
jgi:hypothetical protein